MGIYMRNGFKYNKRDSKNKDIEKVHKKVEQAESILNKVYPYHGVVEKEELKILLHEIKYDLGWLINYKREG